MSKYAMADAAIAFRVARGLPEVPVVEQDTVTGEVFQPEYDALDGKVDFDAGYRDGRAGLEAQPAGRDYAEGFANGRAVAAYNTVLPPIE